MYLTNPFQRSKRSLKEYPFRSLPGYVRILTISILVLLTSCGSFTDPGRDSSPTPTPIAPALTIPAQPTPTPLTDEALIKRIVNHLNLEQKLGQMVIVEFYGPTLNSDLRQMVQMHGVSGILLENKNGNAQTGEQLIKLNQEMQKAAPIPLFITTDYEGGVVNELRRITGERPSNASIGASGDPQKAYDAGHKAATDLKALGLNVNFMPIVDVLVNAKNPGLPQRAFSADPRLVTEMGRAYLKGLSDGGIIGSLKHFPGLGSANLDPHYSLPYMDRDIATLNTVDLVPYRTLIAEGIVPMVMVTHILNPHLDSELPTSLSPKVINKLLRQDLHFQGVIISDTLWMGGISNKYSLDRAAVMAVQAGTDLLLGPRGLAETQKMLIGLRQAVQQGQLSLEQINAAVTRILALKLKYSILSQRQALQLVGDA
jgi:beta-N-acetylhexosaminidase